MDNFDYIKYLKNNKLLTEIKVNNPNFKTPEGWEDETDTYENDESDVETFGGKIIKAYSAPMEGWDEKHQDLVKVIKKEDGKYIVNTYYAFGDDEDEGPFNTDKEAILRAIKIMDEISDNWEEEEDTSDGEEDLDEIKVNKPSIFLPFEAIKPGMIGEDYGNQNVVIIAKGTWDELEHMNTSQASLEDFEDDEKEEIGKECVAIVFIEDYDFEHGDYDDSDIIVYTYGGDGVIVERDWKRLIPKD